MKVKKLYTVVVAILLTFFSNPAHALIDVPTLRFGLGISPISFTAGTAFPTSTPLGSTALLNPMFLWDIPTLRMRAGLEFQADVGSKYGAIATAGVGLTAIFYPMGLSSVREVRDDFSEVVKQRISPYFEFSITPTKFSVTQVPQQSDPTYNTPSSWPYFSARIVELAFGVGLDYPVANDLVVFGGLHYRTAAFSTSDSGSSGQVSYSGIALIFGVMTNFY